MSRPDAKYGKRNVSKMIQQFNDLRQACRAEGTPAIQDALDKVEEHIDYAYRAEAADPLSDPRVVALVEAVTLMGRFFQEVMPKMNVADSVLDANAFDVWNRTGIATSAALRAIGGAV